jgi:O-antigen/teichoic acid export membrane protein
MIGAWVGTAALTFYIVPQQVAQLVHGINGKMLQIVAPMASEFSAMDDKLRIERLFLRGFNLSLVIGLSVAVPLFVLGEPLLRFWVSPEMSAQGLLVLQLLIVAFFLAGLTSIPVNILAGINYPQLVTMGAMVSGVFGALSYWILIKPFGISGVAAGKVFGVAVTIVYYLVVCHRKAPYSMTALSRSTLRLALVTALVGVPAYYLVPPLVGSLFTAIVFGLLIFCAYCLVCWVANVFSHEEKASLLSVGNRILKLAKI